MAKDNERERMPYIQIDSDQWAIMREGSRAISVVLSGDPKAASEVTDCV